MTSTRTSGEKRLTRRELYERVWSTPVSRVAEDLGISGAGLRKACLRHDIPVPPRGHWARQAAGQQVGTPPLPRPEQAGVTIRLNPPRFANPRKPPDPPLRSEALDRRRAYEDDPKHRIDVRSPDHVRLHPWAQTLRTKLRRGRDDGFGLREARAADGVITAHVSEGAIERTALLVDALARAVKTRKFGLVDLRDDTYGGIRYRDRRLKVDGVPLQIRLRERTTRHERPQAKHQARTWPASTTYEYRPAGTLRLTVHAHDGNYGGIERAFKDGADHPLEQQLNAVMVALAEAAEQVHTSRKDRARREHEAREAVRRDAELRYQRELERAREKALLELADRWVQAQRLRDFISAVEESRVVPGPPGAPDDLESWLAWARAKASRLNPLDND